MSRVRCFSVFGLLAALSLSVAVGLSSAAEETKTDKEKERQLIGVLQSDAPPQDKALTCKHLAVYGTEDAVPALAALLPDERLASWARIALEAIPSRAADGALRASMTQLDGNLLVGVMNSIGVRRDADAVAGLASRLAHADDQVASAAAVALGRIGNDAAAGALAQSLTGARAEVRSAVAEGCILCAERLLAEEKATEAAKLYDKVRRAKVPTQRILEATRGTILARRAGKIESSGIPLLVELLRSEDKRYFALGLTTAREMPGHAVTEALIAVTRQASPARQTRLILALADRTDAAVLPAVLEVARSGHDDQVRLVAIQALPRVGNVSCVSALLDLAVDANEQRQQAAKTALEGLPGAEVNANLTARLAGATRATRQVLIELAGRRRIEAATPLLLKATNDADPQVRRSALMALGSTIGPQDLSVLISRVVSPQDPNDTDAAEKALHAACIRMPDRETCAGQLAAAMPGAPVSARLAVVEVLGAMGGTKALSTLAMAAKEDSPQINDAASRLLGQWMTADAAPVLLDLAKNSPEANHQIRALRGYIRIARQFVVENGERAEMCRAALRTAEREAEQALVLEVVQRYPCIEMLEVAVEATHASATKIAATNAALVIAQKMGTTPDAVHKLLAQVGYDRVKLEIIKAEYGAGSNFKDVTQALRQHARDLSVVVLPSPNYNATFGGDPAPGTPKQLNVKYRMNDKVGEVSLRENASVILPMPEDRS